MVRHLGKRALVCVVLWLTACGDDDAPPPPPPTDAGFDAGFDATPFDAGRRDTGGCPDVDGDGSGAAPCGDDCDDADATRFPGATEVCDYEAHDEDCNPATFGQKDDDRDGYVDARCCNGASCADDCDDTRGGAHPGLPEVCNRRDDDCNGVVDEDSQVPGFRDDDRDLYGDPASPIMDCAGRLSVNDTDCDDSSSSAGRRSPAIEEVAADGIDNDCDGTVDEGGDTAVWYRDSDGDGFGVAGDSRTSSTVLVGYALLSGDCDDADSARSPIAAELCNGIDDDCNGLADFVIGINDWEDDDGDGVIDGACGAPADDCDDRARGTYPSAPEVCDGRDNDCDDAVDESCVEPMDGGVPDLGVDLGAADLGPADLGPPDFGPIDAGPPRVSTFIKASNTGTGDEFGRASAISADGTRLAIGAWLEESDATGIDGDQTNNRARYSGAVYVYARVGGEWAQEAYIKASNTGGNDNFGLSLALSADGSRLVVGAEFEDSSATGVDGDQASNAAGDSGAAYVFVRAGTTWTQEAYVKASNTGTNDRFGHSVTISGDGLRIAVGASSEGSNAVGVGGAEADNSASGSGAVYVFARTGTSWAQEAYVKASNTASNDNFGHSVSLSRDGDWLAVGAPREDSNATGVGGDQANNGASASGAVYVFSRAISVWSQAVYLKASNTGAGDNFGHAVSISSDGARVAVGAPFEDSNEVGIGALGTDESALDAGAAYVYARVATTWSFESYVKASNTGMSDTFGWSVAISGDGLRLAVGAPDEDSNAVNLNGDEANDAAPGSGAVYTFERIGAWASLDYVKHSTAANIVYFGRSVALSTDGRAMVVGENFNRSPATGINGDEVAGGAGNSGAAYFFAF